MALPTTMKSPARRTRTGMRCRVGGTRALMAGHYTFTQATCVWRVRRDEHDPLVLGFEAGCSTWSTLAPARRPGVLTPRDSWFTNEPSGEGLSRCLLRMRTMSCARRRKRISPDCWSNLMNHGRFTRVKPLPVPSSHWDRTSLSSTLGERVRPRSIWSNSQMRTAMLRPPSGIRCRRSWCPPPVV